ncbi:hypothetical protein B4U84_23635 [Westiellopsis prolifica IICB1]|nr:hypothetical protein B4U84_23635 [Westiellopsis prolifica IICB1]
MGDWGSGIGDQGSGIRDRGSGIGHWAWGMGHRLFSFVSPHPHTSHTSHTPISPFPCPQSLIPDPRSPIPIKKYYL